MRLTIDHVEEVMFDNVEKDVICFVKHAKKFVLNKTNARKIAQVLGDDPEGWAGRVIELVSSSSTESLGFVDRY